MTKFKRGDKIHVIMEGIVMNRTSDDGVRLTVKNPMMKPAWWAVVPAEACRLVSLTVGSDACGCEVRGDRQYLCQYHMGYADAINEVCEWLRGEGWFSAECQERGDEVATLIEAQFKEKK